MIRTISFPLRSDSDTGLSEWIVMQKLKFLIVILLLYTACSPTEEEDAFRETMISVLSEQYGEIVQQNCTFSMVNYHRLYRKPEFIHIQDEEICQGEFRIHNLEIIAEDSVQVDFSIGYTGNRRFIRNFLGSWNDLIKRYETIDSLRIPDHRYGYAWTYTDPYDQDFFVRFPEEPGGIFATRQWEQLASVKEWFRELSDNRIVSSDSYSVVIVKNEDWEIAIEKNTGEY